MKRALRRKDGGTHLFAIQTPVVGAEDDELVASDVEAAALYFFDAVGVAFVFECRDDFLDFLGLDLFWWGKGGGEAVSLSSFACLGDGVWVGR